MTIVDKAKEVQEKIIAACKRSGRDPQDVQLLPVSKIIRQQVLQNFTKQDGTILARIMFRN